MSETLSSTPIPENSEYSKLGQKLHEVSKRGLEYPPEFLVEFERTHPKDYKELLSLTGEASPSEGLLAALGELDKALYSDARWVLEKSGVKDVKSVEKQGPYFSIKIACPGGDLTLFQPDNGTWMLDGVPYFTGLEAVAEDIAIIQRALKDVSVGRLVGSRNNDEPFGLFLGTLEFDRIGFSSISLHGAAENVFQAGDNDKLLKMLNERYRKIRSAGSKEAVPKP